MTRRATTGSWGLLAALVLWLPACAPTISRPLPDDATGRQQLNAGYALFYTLMSDEAQVGGILAIKDVRPSVQALIDDIAAAAKQTQQQLDRFKKDDPSLAFDRAGLPVVEQSTRNAIRNATTGGLLFSNGESFERALLLTQTKAMNYATYLARSLAKADDSATRAAALDEAADRFEALHHRVVDELALAPPQEPDAAGNAAGAHGATQPAPATAAPPGDGQPRADETPATRPAQ